MTDLWKVRVGYTGEGGLPGVNTLLASTGDTDVDDLRTALAAFYTNWGTHAPGPLSISIPASGDKIDSNTGQISGSWTSGTTTTIPGVGSAARVNSATQVLIQLRTDLILNGRHLRGRIFMPGLALNGIVNAKLDPTVLTNVQTAAATMAIGRLCVYSTTHKEFATVTAVTVWDQLAVLRSRRD